jgi:hypothetical protein
MLWCSLQVALKLCLGSETKKTCETHILVAYTIVVLEVVLQAPLVVECAKAQIAVHVVTPGVVDVVLEPIAVFENALAQVTIVLVIRCLLDVA